MSYEHEEEFRRCRHHWKGVSAKMVGTEVVIFFGHKIPEAFNERIRQECGTSSRFSFKFRYTRDRFNFAKAYMVIREGDDGPELEQQARNYEVSDKWASRLQRNKVQW